MKPLLISIILLCSAATATAQIKDPTKWTFAAKSVSANTYEINITAVVPRPWRIYSQNTAKGGPIPTSITFKKNPALVFVGKAKEIGNLQKAYDDSFKTNVSYYMDKVQFVQTLKVNGQVSKVTGSVEFMVCDGHQCLPPTTRTFDVKLE